MKRVKIEVTDLEIRNGQTFDPFGCPIALALLREFPNVYHGGVDPGFIDMNNFRIKVTRKAKKFIKDFDNKIPVKPFSFYISIPK